MFALPYPPSINSYYATVQGRRVLSKKGRDYKAAVKSIVGMVKPLTGLLSVSIALTPPDNRIRDVDGPIKSLLDSLTFAGVWQDDSQVKKLSVEMLKKGEGRVLVTIQEYLHD